MLDPLLEPDQLDGGERVPRSRHGPTPRRPMGRRGLATKRLESLGLDSKLSGSEAVERAAENAAFGS